MTAEEALEELRDIRDRLAVGDETADLRGRLVLARLITDCPADLLADCLRGIETVITPPSRERVEND